MIPGPADHRDAKPPGGTGGPARDGQAGPSRAGTLCWLCGGTVENPPEIIGQYVASTYRIAHRRCLQVLGALDLNLPMPARPPT